MSQAVKNNVLPGFLKFPKSSTDIIQAMECLLAEYIDKCHFCYPMRRALVDMLPEYLAPRQETVGSMFAQSANSDLVNSTYENMLAVDHKMGISSLYECIKWNSQKEPFELKTFSGKLYNINGTPKGDEKPLHNSIVLIPGAGHFVPQIKPKEFNAALEVLVQKIQSSLKNTHNRARGNCLSPSPTPHSIRVYPRPATGRFAALVGCRPSRLHAVCTSPLRL